MRLIDADRLKGKVLEWMPSGPCGIEEKEIPFETDIVVSLMMEIEEAPSIEVSEEAISREWVLNLYKEWQPRLATNVYEFGEALKDAPSVIPKAKEGKWIMSDIQCKEDTDNGNYQYICSVCGHGDIHARTQEVPHCWWCGAKMKGADDEVR